MSRYKFPMKAVAVLLVLVAAFLLRNYLGELEKVSAAKAAQEDRYATMVEEDNPLLLYFQEIHPDYQIILACQEDITDDGLADLVVIYHDPAERDVNYMRGVLTNANGAHDITHPTRAPIENQQIRFFNMDKKEEMEFVVTGEKNGEVGYAIYRVIGDELINLFGEDMEACC